MIQANPTPKISQKQSLAISKFLFSGRPDTTPLRHSDMDLSFPIPVIGKVALSTPYRYSNHFSSGSILTYSGQSILANQLVLTSKELAVRLRYFLCVLNMFKAVIMLSKSKAAIFSS